MKAILLLLIVGSCMAASQDAKKYCGRRLASTMAYLCDDDSIKRSQRSQFFVYGEDSWPWNRDEERSKRQIVSECCDNPCTIDVLLSYCSA